MEKPYVPSREEMEKAEEMAIESNAEEDKKIIERIKEIITENKDFLKHLKDKTHQEIQVYSAQLVEELTKMQKYMNWPDRTNLDADFTNNLTQAKNRVDNANLTSWADVFLNSANDYLEKSISGRESKWVLPDKK